MDVKATAIIVAAGSGVRFGMPNKAFTSLAGRPLVTYSLDAFQNSPSIERIVVVAAVHTLLEAESLATSGKWHKLDQVIAGGERRQDSVRSGLSCVKERETLVAIQDAARPLVQTHDIERCIEAAAETGAAILAVPVVDTLKRVVNRHILETVPREDLWAAQTPQVFSAEALRAAFQAADNLSLTVTDEANLFEALRMDVVVVRGSPTNIKITVPSDLILAEAMLAQTASEQQ
jgi:2-C-methyl-D-erythritol 4-phosphate cytidylyltransferase